MRRIVNGCATCGEGPYTSKHCRRSKVYDHDYLSTEAQRIQIAKKKSPRLCASCATGDHRGVRTEYGCISTVDAKGDGYVCGCLTCREAAHETHRVMIPRSNTQGVTFVQWSLE